mmetsp:Transcript_29350/g.57135  ORF Transcript_29350/g.57135 Transcript_29350/m.57135 type:complete len:92 (+) Transcript_29350:1505-1780(+)
MRCSPEGWKHKTYMIQGHFHLDPEQEFEVSARNGLLAQHNLSFPYGSWENKHFYMLATTKEKLGALEHHLEPKIGVRSGDQDQSSGPKEFL